MASVSRAVFELFTLSYLDRQWHYTTTNEPITVGLTTYDPIESSVSGITITGDVFKTELTVTILNTSPFVAIFIQGSPDSLVGVEVLRYDLDTDTTSTYFTGEVLTVTVNKTKAFLKCNQSNIQFTKSMMTNYYSKTCRHILYSDTGCRLGQAAFRIDGEVLSVSGNKIKISNVVSTEDNYYTGGKITVGAESKTISEYDTITKELTVLNVFVYASVGDQASVFAGCDHSPETCLLKNNIENFGGEIYIPEENPLERLN